MHDLTPTPESQQAANNRDYMALPKKLKEIIERNGMFHIGWGGAANHLEADAERIVSEIAALRTRAPVDVSHAALADRLEALLSHPAITGSDSQALPAAMREAANALRAHPAGGVSEEQVRAADAAHGVAMSEGKGWREAMREALRAAGIGAGVRPSFRVEVHTMKESHQTTYWVALIRSDCPKDKLAPSAADGYITPSKFLNRDHAYIEAADWAAFLGVAAPSHEKGQ